MGNLVKGIGEFLGLYDPPSTAENNNPNSFGSMAASATPMPTNTAMQDQQQALSQLVGGARAGVTGAFDSAIKAQQQRQRDALALLRGNMGAVGAGTAAASGVQGLLGSGASQASGRQTALQAAQAANQMLGQSAVDIGNILQRRAQAQLQFADKDVQAAQTTNDMIARDIENLRASVNTNEDLVASLRSKASMYEPGTPEHTAYNNAMIFAQQGGYMVG